MRSPVFIRIVTYPSSLSAGTLLATAMRMRFLSLATLTAFLVATSGCTTHHQMARPLTPLAVAQVQDTLERRGAWVEHGWPGQPPQVAAVERGDVHRVGTTTPSLVLLSDDPRQSIPLEYVRSIQLNNHTEGAVKGLLIGALSGGLMGVLLASGGESKCNPGDDGCIGLDFSGAILITSLLIGTAIGVGIGAGVGQRHIYTF